MAQDTTNPSRPNLSWLALLSVLLAFLFPLGSILAILVGFFGLRAINASDGRILGRRLAWTGIVLGFVGTLILVIGLSVLFFLHLRTGSNLANCENHLREIGLGLNKYAAQQADANAPHFYPFGTVPNDLLKPEERLSWYVEVLPYTPQHAVVEKLDRGQSWDGPANRAAANTNIRGILCPASTPERPGLTNYVGIAGLGPDAATLEKPTDPRAGVFGYERHVSLEAIERGRGTSQTMAVVETAWQIGPWAQGGSATVRGVDPAQKPYLGTGRPFGGLHAGITNVLFVDGSVRHMENGIEPRIFEAHATIGAR